LPVIWFPNDWTATSPSNSRYRKRCETRNGGGSGGAETIRYAARRANVQRDFDARVAARFESRESSLLRDSQERPTMIRVAFRLARRRGPGLRVGCAVVPGKREVFLFKRGAWDAVQESLDHGPHTVLPGLLDRECRPPFCVRTVANPRSVLCDERQAEVPEPLLQIGPGSAAHEHDLVRR